MLTLNRKSDTLIIVVHEIYGINQHIADVCELLSEQNYDIICPNLLERATAFDYSREQMAYKYFMEQVGFVNGFQKVKEIIEEIHDDYSKVFILGFSAGATIAWLCSELDHVDGVVGYYGSRIRDYVSTKPKCPVLLFFSETEKSFDVNELVLTLDRQNVNVHLCSGEHGFSDPYSSKYNKEAAQIACNETLNFYENR